jgi:hypothetical protein
LILTISFSTKIATKNPTSRLSVMLVVRRYAQFLRHMPSKFDDLFQGFLVLCHLLPPAEAQ